MTGPDPAPPVGAHPPATAEAWQAGRLTALSLAQLVSWGILFYALIVAAPAISDDTGWPLALVTALFSLGLIASAILGLLGAGQVIGRLIYVALPHGAPPRIALTITSALAALALLLLAAVPGPAWLLIGIGVAAGAVRGAQTLVQGSAVAERWGTRDYGAINGVFAAPITIVAALGPTLGPVAATAAGGYGAVAIAAAGVALLGALIARWS